MSRHTRHVWVLGDRRWETPHQGLVIDWKRHSYKWFALVVLVDPSVPEQPFIVSWFPAQRLLPVRSIPEDLMGNPFEKALWERRRQELEQ